MAEKFAKPCSTLQSSYVCLSQYLYGKTSLKENLHQNQGANSQMFTQKIHFNYGTIFRHACINLLLLFIIMKQKNL